MPTIRKAVEWLKANLQDLEALACDQEAQGRLRAEIGTLTAELHDLRTQADAVVAKIAADSQMAEELRAKRARSAEAAERVATQRLEDLQRQIQALEGQAQVLRETLEAQGKARAQREAEHAAALQEAQRRLIQAEDQYAKTQERIKALHDRLAGVVET